MSYKEGDIVIIIKTPSCFDRRLCNTKCYIGKKMLIKKLICGPITCNNIYCGIYEINGKSWCSAIEEKHICKGISNNNSKIIL